MISLLDQIKELLWTEWDPIGVNGSHVGMDEYDSYARGVYRMLMEGRDHFAVSQYLERSALQDIGLSQSENHAAIAARAIEIFEREK